MANRWRADPCDTDIDLFIVLRGLMSVFGGCGVVVIVVRAPGGVGRTMPDLVKSSKVAQVEWTISTSLLSSSYSIDIHLL